MIGTQKPFWMPDVLPVQDVVSIRRQIEARAPVSPAWWLTDDGLPEHAIDGPSSWPRVLFCTASVALCKHLVSPDSDWSYEGSVAHHLAEYSYKQNRSVQSFKGDGLIPTPDGLEPVVVTQDMIDHIERFNDYCMSWPGDLRFSENIVDLTYWARDCFGSCDFLVADTHNMILDVIDLKYGTGVPVHARTTPQPLGYAMGAIWALAESYGTNWQKIRCHIHQPRLDSITVVEYSMAEVISFGEWVSQRLLFARTPRAEFWPGVKQCQFCAAKDVCSARAEHYVKVIENAKRAVPEPQRIRFLSEARLSEIITETDGAVRFCNSLEKAALQRALDGGDVPGYKLVEGISRQSWLSETRAVMAMTDAADGDKSQCYTEPKLLSPNAAKNKFGAKLYRKHIEKHVHVADGRPTLVPTTDPRPELVRKQRYKSHIHTKDT